MDEWPLAIEENIVELPTLRELVLMGLSGAEMVKFVDIVHTPDLIALRTGLEQRAFEEAASEERGREREREERGDEFESVSTSTVTSPRPPRAARPRPYPLLLSSLARAWALAHSEFACGSAPANA